MFQKIDKPLFFAFISLTIFGIIMMSFLSQATSVVATGETHAFFWQHLKFVGIGSVVFLFFLQLKYETIKNLAPLIYIVSLILLILVFTSLGANNNTQAKSWLDLGLIPRFQPVEIAKLSIVIFLSALFSSQNYKNQIHTIEKGFIPFGIILSMMAILIILQPDFGSLFILTLSASSIYFVAGASWKHFIGGSSIAIFIAALLVKMSGYSYIFERFSTFWNPSTDTSQQGYQIEQALIIIGSGGWFGQGISKYIEKYHLLPEVETDTIIAAIAEQIGFLRMVILLSVYLFIAHRGALIARFAPDDFTKYLAVGLTTWIVGQAFINIAVNLALFPNTGITLPLISKGGTSMILTMASFGILLHISNNLKVSNRHKHK